MVRAPEQQLLPPGCSEAASLPRSTLCIRTRHTRTAEHDRCRYTTSLFRLRSLRMSPTVASGLLCCLTSSNVASRHFGLSQITWRRLTANPPTRHTNTSRHITAASYITSHDLTVYHAASPPNTSASHRFIMRPSSHRVVPPGLVSSYIPSLKK